MVSCQIDPPQAALRATVGRAQGVYLLPTLTGHQQPSQTDGYDCPLPVSHGSRKVHPSQRQPHNQHTQDKKRLSARLVFHIICQGVTQKIHILKRDLGNHQQQ